MEECVTRFPQYADFKRMEDENTALHIAASNDKLEILKYLCSLVRLMYSSYFTSAYNAYNEYTNSIVKMQYSM
jgi:ankyrin repeat protein